LKNDSYQKTQNTRLTCAHVIQKQLDLLNLKNSNSNELHDANEFHD